MTTIPLLGIPTARSFGVNNAHANYPEICKIARAWSQEKWGLVISDPTVRGISFELWPEAFRRARRLRRKQRLVAWRNQIFALNWTVVSAVSALIAALAAIASAYFSYLSLASK